MKITVIAIGSKMESWVEVGVDEYVKRFLTMNDYSLQMKLLPAQKRTKNSNIAKIIQLESDALLANIPNNCCLVALDVGGKRLSSESLASKLESINNQGQNLAILIGGPDGFDDRVRQSANERWSLSDLTLPHPIVRVIIAETLYRSVSIIKNHPYHRA